MLAALARDKNAGLSVAATLFGLVALVHALRLLMHLSVVIGGRRLPQSASAIGLVATGSLSIWLWTLRSSRD